MKVTRPQACRSLITRTRLNKIGYMLVIVWLFERPTENTSNIRLPQKLASRNVSACNVHYRKQREREKLGFWVLKVALPQACRSLIKRTWLNKIVHFSPRIEQYTVTWNWNWWAAVYDENNPFITFQFIKGCRNHCSSFSFAAHSHIQHTCRILLLSFKIGDSITSTDLINNIFHNLTDI
jgi:hypothetical protein